DKGLVATSNGEISKDVKALQERVIDTEAPAAMPAAEIPAEQPEATDAAAQPAATTEAPATAPAK
ncbi:MAG: hypothetical protein RR298_03535, partial [Alistipes sp.]